MNIFKTFILGVLIVNSTAISCLDSVPVPVVSQNQVIKHADSIMRDVKLRKVLLYSVAGLTCGAFTFEVYSIANSLLDTNEKPKSNNSQPEVVVPSMSTTQYFSQFGSWLASTGKNIMGITIMAVVYEFVSHTISDSINHIIYTESIKSFDTHCSRCIPLIQHIQRDIQRVLDYRSSGRGAVVDKESLVYTSKRLVERAERLLGYMYAKRKNFSAQLSKESRGIEERFGISVDEFSYAMHELLAVVEEDIDYLEILDVLQKYESILNNEIEHFSFVEEDNQEKQSQ